MKWEQLWCCWWDADLISASFTLNSWLWLNSSTCIQVTVSKGKRIMPFTELNMGILLMTTPIKWSSFSHHHRSHTIASTSIVTLNFTSGDLSKMPNFTDLEVLENFSALCCILNSWLLHWECLRLSIHLFGFHPASQVGLAEIGVFRAIPWG